MIDGHVVYGLDAFDICLVPNMAIHPKFKIPEFEKYKGLSYPGSHLVMFCRKMESYAHKDKLIINYFKGSLSGASLKYNMHLERS